MATTMRQCKDAGVRVLPTVRGRRGLRAALVAALGVLLVACGGGGGDGGGSAGPGSTVLGPPGVGAALATGGSEAGQAAQAVAVGADTMVARSGLMSGVNALVRVPVVPARSPSIPGRAYAMAVRPYTCTDFVAAPCTGSVVVDTDIADTATSARAGQYVDVRFSNVSGMLFGESITLDGRLRIDFVSPVDLNAPVLNGLNLKLTLDALKVTLNGATYGPVSDVDECEIDSQGKVKVTTGGVTYGGFAGVTVSGSGDYGIEGGSLRTAYWGSSSQYVDVSLSHWQVRGGRPTMGSQALITAGSGSATVSVTSTSQATVVYAVSLTGTGGTFDYTVTATYPAGGSAATYSAVAAH